MAPPHYSITDFSSAKKVEPTYARSGLKSNCCEGCRLRKRANVLKPFPLPIILVQRFQIWCLLMMVSNRYFIRAESATCWELYIRRVSKQIRQRQHSSIL